MFTHQQSFEHYQTHVLKDNQGNMIEVVPTRGGIISRFEVEAKPVFYLDRETLNQADKNVRGGNPILFPICGPLAAGVYQLHGKTYQMKQHGFARNLAWSIMDIQTATEWAVITLRLTSNAETLAQYPFAFNLDFTYRLMAKSLTIEQRYCNQSDYCMPFYAGFHPYFAATNKSGVKLTLPHREMEDFLTGETRLLPEIIDFDALAETNGALHNINTNSVKLDNFGQQRAIEIHFTPPYQHIVLWALKDKPFLCVEPCMGINNGLNLAESVVELAAHACLETSVTFSIKD